MQSQIAIKPVLNVEIKKNIKTTYEVSRHEDTELTTCKFNNNTPINNVFTKSQYIDYIVPSGFSDITKISQAVIDLECQVSKTLPPVSQTPQTLYIVYAQDPPYNGLVTVNPGTAVAPLYTYSANSTSYQTTSIHNYLVAPSPEEYLGGTYTIQNIKARVSTVAYQPVIRVGLQKYNVITGSYTNLIYSFPQNLTTSTASYSFTLIIPPRLINSNERLSLRIQVKNNLPNPGTTTFTTDFDNSVAPGVTLNRNINIGEYYFIQNVPVWALIDRIQLLINGSVADEISGQNYFCELSLQHKETLAQYANSMLYDKDNYGLSSKYPGVILLTNPSNATVTVSDVFKYQIPLFSTFLTSSNYITDFVKEKITIRLFIKPYSSFKISNSFNTGSMKLLSSSLYLTGTKYLAEDIEKLREERGSSDSVSMILLRKYGAANLIRTQQPTGLTFAPLYGQSIYDLSFINGRFICLFTFLYPENAIGGENFVQSVLTPSSTATIDNYSSSSIIYNVNANTYPRKVNVSKNIGDEKLEEYLYTPDSGFRLDRVSIINDLGNPVYQNLQYANFLRNVMSTTGVNNDFLKTYAIYPFYFSNKIKQDYDNQHAENGYLSIKNIYNMEIILSNPESSSLPIYDTNGNLINVLQNSLWTCGLMIAEMHIKPNGKISIHTS